MEKDFVSSREESDFFRLGESYIRSQWFMVVREDGTMQCSCGRPLVKMDSGMYRCRGGFPIYRPAEGEIIIDKFGNLMMKIKPHSEEK